MSQQHSLPPDEHFVSQMTASQRALRTFILGLVPDQVAADDLLQEVNLALWRKRELYDSSQDFVRWAFGFAALEVRRYRSRAANDRLWFSDDTIEALASDWPEANDFLDDCERALARCLQKLGNDESQVVKAKYRQRQTAKQIAESMNRPLSTVYKILQRALTSLRHCIKSAELQAGH